MTKKKAAATKKKTTKKKAPAKKAAAKKTAKKKSAKKKSTAKSSAKKPAIPREEKRMMIALHAYYKWEKAGRPDNSDTHHWLEAEKEIEAMLK